MDKDRLVGSAKQIKGTVKQVIGKADAKLDSDGKADKIEGKVQNAIGGLNQGEIGVAATSSLFDLVPCWVSRHF
jgi:uncharacterized protein YjbJ (UPF0337 family)